jgi:hypothetical protein
VSCRRSDNYRGDITAENKISVIWSVEKKEKVVLRVGCNDAAKVLIGKPADAFEPAMKQQSCIYNYIQISNLFCRCFYSAGVKDYLKNNDIFAQI